MKKIQKQDLIDIIDIKNTELNDKNGVTNMSYVIQICHFINKSSVRNCSSIIFLMGINNNYFLIEFCFEVIVLSEGNTCIA